MMEILVEEWCSIPSKVFQTLVDSMPRHSEAFWLVSQRPIKILYVGVSFILALTYMFQSHFGIWRDSALLVLSERVCEDIHQFEEVWLTSGNSISLVWFGMLSEKQARVYPGVFFCVLEGRQ
jgi:hypothetical protein